MTTMTFESFAAQPQHRRRIRRATVATPPAQPITPSFAAPAPRRKAGSLALVGAIACLHLAAIHSLNTGQRSIPAAPKPVAVTIALAAPRVQPPPPPPPEKIKAAPPRKSAAIPVRAAPARAPSPVVSNDLPLAAATPESVPAAPAVAAPGPAVAPAPAPVAEEKVTEPRGYAGYLRNPAPDYPPAAQRRGLEGQVVLKVHVLASGQPDSVTVARSSGHAILDDAAIKAVVQWAFAPARRGQAAIDGWVQVPLTFKI